MQTFSFYFWKPARFPGFTPGNQLDSWPSPLPMRGSQGGGRERQQGRNKSCPKGALWSSEALLQVSALLTPNGISMSLLVKVHSLQEHLIRPRAVIA